MLRHVAKHSKQRKTTKLIKLQWIASIWCQNGHKSQNYKRNQITMNCIDLMSKRSKIAKLHKQSNYNELLWFDVKTFKTFELGRKTTKEIKLQWIASIWHQNDLKCWDTLQNYKSDHITMNLHRFDVKTITTMLNYKRDQITMNCIDLMSKTSNQRKTTKEILFRRICIDLTSKRSKMLSYVAKHSKQRKTTKLVKLQWIASIWCQKHQTNAKLQKWSYFDELHRFDVKTIKTTQNYETDQIIMHCINLPSKRSKKLIYEPKLQKWSNFNELHRFDVKTIKKPKTKKGNQITNNLHRFDIKTI